MALENRSTNHNAESSTTLLLRLLLLKLEDYIVKRPIFQTQLTEKLTILRNDIYSRPQDDWSIDEICRSLSISASYLQHKYKQLFGNGIKQDITASRIEYSKNLLKKTNYTVAEISRIVGYANDMTYMYIFKKKTGFTPTQYRNSSITYLK